LKTQHQIDAVITDVSLLCWLVLVRMY